MARKAPKNETNVEFVTKLMEFSNHGPLAQLFVLDALEKWSKIIASKDASDLDSPMICGAAWKSTAQEINDKINARFAK